MRTIIELRLPPAFIDTLLRTKMHNEVTLSDLLALRNYEGKFETLQGIVDETVKFYSTNGVVQPTTSGRYELALFEDTKARRHNALDHIYSHLPGLSAKLFCTDSVSHDTIVNFVVTEVLRLGRTSVKEF